MNVAQSPPCGTPQAMAGFRFVMDSCGTPAVPVVEPQLVRRPAGVTAAGAGLWLRCWGGALEDAARGRFACRCERTARSPLSRGARRKPPVGFEPTTCGLQSREHRTEGTQPQELTSAPTNACTNACTDGVEIEHGGPADGASATAVGTVSTGGAGAAGERFAAALAMIATLPLTDAEKAEAVRRLLGGATGGPR